MYVEAPIYIYICANIIVMKASMVHLYLTGCNVSMHIYVRAYIPVDFAYVCM